MSESENPVESTRRILAAIVFTDIVDFSALTQRDEERTLRLAHRDMDCIRKICQHCQGKVLKSTGDGLLMYFESATQAVACAMQTQKKMADLVRTCPPEEVLQHRIGIHLGDVFVSQDDVMGDGVNVAARLQAEAPPGGICISQTVYDVVKNRLDVKATYLGPRELKNIQEAVPVYQILVDAASVTRGVQPPGKGATSKWRWLVAGSCAAVVLGVFVVLGIVWMSDTTDQEQAGTLQSPGFTSSRRPGESARRGRVDRAKRRYLPGQDFKGFVKWLEDNKLGETPLCENYRKLDKFKSIVKVRLMSASKEDPIEIAVPTPQGSVQVKVWFGDDGMFRIQRPPRASSVTTAVIRPKLMVSVYEAVAQSKQQKNLVAFLISEYQSLGLMGTP